MALRVVDEDIRDIIETDPDVAILPFQAVANALTDKVEANDANGLMNDVLLAEVERYLTAGFYALRDQIFSEKRTGDSSALFQTGHHFQKAGCFEQNDYLRAAMGIDITGYLASLNQQGLKGGGQVGITWLGLAPSAQTDFVNRD